jgi:hypothetical protein
MIRETAIQIVIEDLGLRKISAKMVAARMLTDAQKRLLPG